MQLCLLVENIKKQQNPSFCRDTACLAALIEELDRRGIRTKGSRLADGSVRGQIRFGAGALAYLLKNRFYIGEIVYRGEVHRGEQEPILDRGLFEAVQAQLAANAVARRVRLKGSSAILTGRIFDDRGNRMSPAHSNKRGVRYRYYVSHALLQKQKTGAGAVSRVPAPEIEALVLAGIRQQIASSKPEGLPRSRRSLSVKAGVNGTCACSRPSPLCHRASLRQLPMARRLRI